MKYLKKILILLIPILMVSCGDDDDNTPTPVDPLDSQANLLNGNWQV